MILEAYGFTDANNINALQDLSKESNNRVGVFIGNTEKDVTEDSSAPVYNASTGILMGRLSKIRVHEHPGKVKELYLLS